MISCGILLSVSIIVYNLKPKILTEKGKLLARVGRKALGPGGIRMAKLPKLKNRNPILPRVGFLFI